MILSGLAIPCGGGVAVGGGLLPIAVDQMELL